MQTIIELLRRVLALAGLLVGAWAFFWPGPPLLVVAPVDFRHDFEKRITTTKEDLADPQALADFVAYRTGDRTVDVVGRDWLDLAASLTNPGPELDQRMTSGGTRPRFVFRPKDQPWASLEPLREFQYLKINSGEAWLSVSLQPRQEIIGLPYDWAHPWQGLGLYLMGGGLLAYALLPRRRPGKGELRYGRFASVLGADMLGLLFAAMFAILPLLIVWSNDPDGSLLSVVSSGWLALALPLWLMAALGLVLLGVGTRYALLAWRVDEDGLVKIVGGSETRYAWADMDRAEPYAGRAGRIIGTLLLLFGRTPGQAGQGMLVAGNEACGARIFMKNGHSFKIMANHLDGFDAILKALHARSLADSARSGDFFASV